MKISYEQRVLKNHGGRGILFARGKYLAQFRSHASQPLMQVNATQMEARMLLRRICSRVPNLNSYFLIYLRSNHDFTILIDAAHKMRYATKYAPKTGRHSELLNEVIECLSQRSMDLIPTNMQHVLSQLLVADVSHRAFMSKQQLSYHVMDLPLVMKTFEHVDVVGFYRRSYLTQKYDDDRTLVYSDCTEYLAYAERCSAKNDGTEEKEHILRETP